MILPELFEGECRPASPVSRIGLEDSAYPFVENFFLRRRMIVGSPIAQAMDHSWDSLLPEGSLEPLDLTDSQIQCHGRGFLRDPIFDGLGDNILFLGFAYGHMEKLTR